MKLYPAIRFICIGFLVLISGTAFSQEKWGEGELEDVEIEIVKERQITLPKANRNFEKILPGPSDPVHPPLEYTFRTFAFQSSPINPAIRPLRLKQESPSHVYGAQVSIGYGNYGSPYLEGFINSRRNKNSLVGAHAYFNASSKGPVDGKNSGSGTSGVSLYGKSFNDHVSVSGELRFDNRTTHFYGYPSGTDVSARDIRQSFNVFDLDVELSNSKSKAFSYELGGAFSYLADRYDARETEVDFTLNSAYRISEDSRISITSAYYLINREDAFVEPVPRSLFFVNPAFVFYPVEDLQISAGIKGAFENDSIDNKDVHVYPDIRVSYPLSPSVDVVASLTGGIEKVSLHTLAEENLWLAPNVPIYHTNALYDFQAALHARVGNKVSLNAGLSFASLKNWYFFVNQETGPSKFDVRYDLGSTERTNFFGSIGFVQNENARFLLRGDLYSYDTDEEQEAWHRPAYKFTADAFFNVYKKLLFEVNLIALGGMKARSLTGTPVELDPAFDLNVRTGYRFSDKVSLFIQLNNITSNEYPVYMNYPVRGFQVLGGLTCNF